MIELACYVSGTQEKVSQREAWLRQSKQNCEGLEININQQFRDNGWSTSSYNPTVSIWTAVAL